MSSSIATANTTGPVSTMAAIGPNSIMPSVSGARASSAAPPNAMPAMAAQFREIHKNTWLKRLTAEGKKVFVGPKKSDRSWVVFCVHDDTEALLEGYAEPRQAPSHNPEWVVSMQDTLHISHALIPNSHEFEFVVTLSNEVVRFHAMSWDIMQEWVETLRSKLREMKILSPRENLYTKLPEVRLPLLPTRDPTSPLPAPPPVPAAIVPGVERVIPPSVQQQQQNNTIANDSSAVTETLNDVETTTTAVSNASSNTSSIDIASNNPISVNNTPSSTIVTSTTTSTSSYAMQQTTATTTPILTSMSNTLTQNLLNMLSDPISAYSEQINDANSSSSSLDPDEMANNATTLSLSLDRDLQFNESQVTEEEFIGPLLRKPSVNTSDFNSFANHNSVRVDVLASHRASADHVRNMENFVQLDSRIPRPQTSRSLSAGAVDKSIKRPVNHVQENEHLIKDASQALVVANSLSSRGNNITELEVNSDFESQSAASNSADTKSNITIIQVSTNIVNGDKTSTSDNDYEPPKLPHKSSNAEIFTFTDAHVAPTTTSTPIKSSKQHEYKSNVQIIPSSSSSSSSNSNSSSTNTIQVMGSVVAPQIKSAVGNQYTTPVKKTAAVVAATTAATIDEHSKVTTVHVAGTDNTYGTCFTQTSSMVSTTSASHSSTPKLPKKIILSANTSGITNISVNNSTSDHIPMAAAAARRASTKTDIEKAANTNKNNALHYEKVFLASTAAAAGSSSGTVDIISAHPTTSSSSQQPDITPMSPKWSSPLRQMAQNKSKVDLGPLSPTPKPAANGISDKKPKTQAAAKQHSSEHNDSRVKPTTTAHGSGHATAEQTVVTLQKVGSPALQRRRVASPSNTQTNAQIPRPPFALTRGLTEAVITARPSRRDFHFLNKLSSAKAKSSQQTSATPNVSNKSSVSNANNNGDVPGPSTASTQTPTHMAINRATSEAVEQRRRSSSTSDAQGQRHSRGANNNEFSNRSNGGNAALRQPPQPFRVSENLLGGGPSNMHNSTSSPSKRMTLREQQVMQLRREIMHPGGVRLQLRRKDCVGSIAWVDAFGAVWVAGWKQKEHPVLYNALHIGDQLLSIAGVTISSAAEANKIIRNTNTLFVEVLVRRIPFGRGYAIRREREGQCLGLIRDGNTATIVDVVPNSLAARHGLPPKAQSCDGTTLTFWVLTEINGRPLNLFFKDNEIRDRLNSVGRDISILVQPSDLITKLKKQLKSLRGYKDYLVQ
uniref:PH domain-containing protein n=1 Tax=Stomoxys calcitrans TaxID=35570 RepID=A0A1I8Q8K4_STOCA